MNAPFTAPVIRRSALAGLCILIAVPFCAAQIAGRTPTAAEATLRDQELKDAVGHGPRRAPTGHVTNYDEYKIPAYTLPDPLVLKNGQPVRDREMWFKQRRPEIIAMYETEIYGRVPANAPKVTAKVVKTDAGALDGKAALKEVELHFGETSDGPTAHLHLYLPAGATKPAPLILSISFSGAMSRATAATATAPAVPSAPRPVSEPIAEIVARGYGFAYFTYTEIQPDRANTFTSGVIGLTLAPGQTKPAPDEWGDISAWAWGLSRVQDYLETDRDVDAKRVAIVGHSRLGKTVLWAGAKDERFAMVYSSQGGEMGSALSRRDYGETIDDMVAGLGYHFAGNFQKYSGHWNDMPVDSHCLISLSAPRPVFVSGGNGDPWSDSHGEFLGMVAAGPVYRLLGQPDLGTTEMPALDVPVVTGKLAFLNHKGPHAITPLDWKTFLDYADRFLKSSP